MAKQYKLGIYTTISVTLDEHNKHELHSMPTTSSYLLLVGTIEGASELSDGLCDG